MGTEYTRPEHFDPTTEKGKYAAGLKLGLGMMAMQFRQHLTSEEAAAVLISTAADLLASSSGSSAIKLGRLTARYKDVLDKEALTCFEVLGGLGLN